MHSGCKGRNKTIKTHSRCPGGFSTTETHLSAVARLRQQQTWGLVRASSWIAENHLFSTSSCGRRDWGALWVFCLFYCFNKETNPKAPHLNTIAMGLGFQTRNLGGRKHSVYNSLHRKHQRPEKKVARKANEFNRSEDTKST